MNTTVYLDVYVSRRGNYCPVPELTKKQKRKIYLTAGLLNGCGCPIRVNLTAQPPKFLGESFYYTTPTGRTRIAHPNAYYYPKLYHPSTREVVVGWGWVKQHCGKGIK